MRLLPQLSRSSFVFPAILAEKQVHRKGVIQNLDIYGQGHI